MKQRSYFILNLFFVVIISLFILPQCINKEKIYIGAILTLTGPLSDIGIEMKNSLQIASDEINSSGGINNRKVQFIFEDSRWDKNEGVNAYNKIEKNFHPLFYITDTSYVTLPLTPILELNKTPLISLFTMNPEITKNKKWVFKYYNNAKEEAEPIKILINKLKIRSVGMMYSDEEGSKSIIDELSNEVKADIPGIVIKNASYQLSEKDFESQIKKLSDMDAIYFTLTTDNVADILEQIKTNNYKGIILSTNLL
jgi:branched-chain amino acid transport system substrate-binding protein